MFKKMLGVFTSIVAGLAVVGVAWASGDDGTSTSVTTATETSASVSSDVSTPTTDVTLPDSSTSVTFDDSTSTSMDDDSTTSTSIAASTSTSAAGSATTSTSIGASTSTSVDDSDRRIAPDGVTAHTIPGVGTVTIEVVANQLFLVNVTAPGWNVEHDKIESDRIELEFTNSADAEAEFRARINNGRVEVRIEVD